MRGIRERRPGRFSVTVSVNGIDKNIGTFGSVHEAIQSRDEARNERLDRPAPPPKARKRSKYSAGVVEVFTARGPRYEVMVNVRRQSLYGGRFETRKEALSSAQRLRANPPPPLPESMTKLAAPGISVTLHRPRGASKTAPKVARYQARKRKGERTGGGSTVGTFDTLQAARAALGLSNSDPSAKHS